MEQGKLQEKQGVTCKDNPIRIRTNLARETLKIQEVTEQCISNSKRHYQARFQSTTKLFFIIEGKTKTLCNKHRLKDSWSLI